MTETLLYIGGQWLPAESGRTLEVINPATEEVIGTAAHAGPADLDKALVAAAAGFAEWRRVSAFERSKIMRRAAELIRARADSIAPIMTREQGKPLGEAKIEIMAAADIIDWFAEEARRAYGRVIPSRTPGVHQLVIKEPVGPVAAFTPWNFPINQAVRKISAALAAGCSVILKAPEETPASPAELVRAYADAGLPPGVLNLVYGTPSEISEYLIPHPVIAKISFTGSVAVGKHLAALAGAHMKRATMELGGHSPAMVFNDADIDAAARILTGSKIRNAGQVCISPTRFLIQRGVYEQFTENFVARVKAVRPGDGLLPESTMGPLANGRRVAAIEGFVADATSKGATVLTGGNRIGNKGFFFEPTVLTDITREMRVMNEEPFGPLALLIPFDTLDDALEEANRLRFGLAAYAFTSSAKTANTLSAEVSAGMLTLNQLSLALPEVPFGGVKDSGYGSEGGTEAIEAYLNPKFVSYGGV